jgi:hypothetical protein
MKHLATSVVVLLFGWTTSVFAAEAEPADTDAEPAAQSSAAPADKRTDATSQTKGTSVASEEFTPSESISEDFAVSFPVDI